MTQARPVKTKALSAFFVNRGSSLTAALSQVGVDLACLQNETINEDIIGRIARRYGLTPERLVELAETFA